MTVETESQDVLSRPVVSPTAARDIGAVAKGFEKRAMEGFGKRLKEAREKAGLRQDEVADLVGKTRNTIYLWEKGRYGPQGMTTKAFTPLARRLKVSVEWLLYGVDISPDAGTDPKVEKLREVAREFGRRYPALSEVLEILDKAAASDPAAANARDEILAFRRSIRDMEDILDS